MALSLLGILSAAGAGGAAPSGGAAYELISSTILGSDTASVTFSSIPSDYKHLQVRAVARLSKTTDTLDNSFVRLNGNTGANYSWHLLEGNGTSVSSSGNSSASFINLGDVFPSNFNANYAGGFVMDLLDYSSTAKNTTTRALSGAHTNQKAVNLTSGAFYNTAAVTSLEIYQSSFNYKSGSRFSLYGIKG